MKSLLALALAICVVLSGCTGLFDGSYESVKLHEQSSDQIVGGAPTVVNYGQLCQAIRSMARSGATIGAIDMSQYDADVMERDVAAAIKNIMTNDPIAAYAVADMQFEIKQDQQQPTASLRIQYLHDRSEIQRIVRVDWMEEARTQITDNLVKFDTGIVLYIEQYEDTKLAAWIENWAALHPESIMEVPQVSVSVYPKEGVNRVVELLFTYENDRQTLRGMQQQVQQLFDAAILYVGDATRPAEKYARLYTFLMERFQNYTMQTSVTPSYSLLIEGKGDSEAFARVYAAMCRLSGLECITVTGQRYGQTYCWNMIRGEDAYYHVDLLECEKLGGFSLKTDEQMSEYEWDYSAYPSGGEKLPDDT